MIKKEKENERDPHPYFIGYMESIVSHKNYEGLYYSKKDDGSVKWVEAGKSEYGLRRRGWWDKKCKEYGVPIKAGCYARIAFIVHPTKLHTCQICGRQLSIEYIYPNKNLTKKIKTVFNVDVVPFEKNIYEIIDKTITGKKNLSEFCYVFKIDDKKITNKTQFIEEVKLLYIDTFSKTFFSPGVMSNSPDRFDGYHSDGACCRSVSDKGRHKDNLSRYNQDRRAYENWSDGDWKKANMLMGEFRKKGVSADHIGPISLGFCHRAKFNPLTHEENSSKNNRMSLDDIKCLLEDEKIEQVVSWHSKYIWDKHKTSVKSDIQAVKLSSLMRKNLHSVLIILSMIHERGQDKFLMQFLHPEYSYHSYRFVGFDKDTGRYKSVTQEVKEGENQKKNAERYIRISFEELDNYAKVENRSTNNLVDDDIILSVKDLISQIGKRTNDESVSVLKKILKQMAESSSLE